MAICNYLNLPNWHENVKYDDFSQHFSSTPCGMFIIPNKLQDFDLIMHLPKSNLIYEFLVLHCLM